MQLMSPRLASEVQVEVLCDAADRRLTVRERIDGVVDDGPCQRQQARDGREADGHKANLHAVCVVRFSGTYSRLFLIKCLRCK